MKWHERHDTMIQLAFFAFCLFLLALFGLLIAAWSHAAPLPDCASIKAVTVDPRFIVKQPDGDTFHVFTFDVPNVVKIRVADAETPEHGQEGFEEATAVTHEWLHRGPFRVVTCGKPTLDRIVGMVVRGDENLADVLKAAGYWRPTH